MRLKSAQRLLSIAVVAAGFTLLPVGASAGPTDLADTSVSISHSPEPAEVSDKQVVFTITIANSGPATANAVELTTVLLYPNGSSTSGAPFRRYDAIPSQGTCPTPSFGQPSTPVTCQLGSITAGGSAQVTITIATYRLQGAITLQAAVRATEIDSDPGDNADSDIATVNGSPI